MKKENDHKSVKSKNNPPVKRKYVIKPGRISGKDKNYTAETLLNAIKGSRGVITAISNNLNCDRATAEKYIVKYPECIAAVEQEREGILDKCESRIYDLMECGEAQLSAQLAKFILTTQGRKRGFIEKLDIKSENRTEIVYLDRQDENL